MKPGKNGVVMTNGHLNKSETRASAHCVHTTSRHYYGDDCPGHHLGFIELAPLSVVDDEDDEPSLADKLRRIDTFEPHQHRIGRMRREKVEAFESYNAETFEPELEGP